MSSKKTIGIITLQNGNNYGAMFQIYAFTRYLETKGHNVFVINYHYQADKTKHLKYMMHPIATIRKILSKKAFSFKFLKQKKQGGSETKREQSFDLIFDDFREKHLNIEGAPSNYQELIKNCPNADIFICGSDQVWADDFFFSSPAFLLGFAPKDAIKVSYAASFGKETLEPYLHSTFKKHLKQFKAVSVREKSGVGIVKEVSKIDSSHVLDPTLLLDNYSELIDYSLVPDGPYLLVYRLSQDYELTQWMTNCIKQISEIKGYPVFSVTTNCPWSLEEGNEELKPTPGQLLGLIERSSLFVTNSFHGTVFSIILKIKFLTFARDAFSDKQNIRMTSLLSSLKLNSLYCSHFCDIEDICQKIDLKYDYDEAHRELAILRKTSVEFLGYALS